MEDDKVSKVANIAGHIVAGVVILTLVGIALVVPVVVITLLVKLMEAIN